MNNIEVRGQGLGIKASLLVCDGAAGQLSRKDVGHLVLEKSYTADETVGVALHRAS